MTWSRTDHATLARPREELWQVLTDRRQWRTWCPAAPPPHSAEARTTADAPWRLVLTGVGGHLRVTWTLTDVTAAGDVPMTRWEQRVEVISRDRGRRGARAARALTAEVHRDAVRLFAAAGGAPQPGLLKVVVAGGSGALGQRLVADLACRGHAVVVLSRTPDDSAPVREVGWDGQTLGPWAAELADPSRTALVNLAGKLVDVRPTAANVLALRQSRVASTRALVEASRRLEDPLARWVQASTTAIYSDAGEQPVTESSPVPATGMPQMTGVAVAWEAAAAGARAERMTVLRTSLVLDRQVPVMDRMLMVTRMGLGGPIGSGRQWMSWIHVDDWLAVVRAALGLDPAVDVSGTVIASAPHPVRNTEMMGTLRRRLGRPWAPPTPVPLLRLGSVVLRTDPALAATGRHATSEVLAGAGFGFPEFGHSLSA